MTKALDITSQVVTKKIKEEHCNFFNQLALNLQSFRNAISRKKALKAISKLVLGRESKLKTYAFFALSEFPAPARKVRQFGDSQKGKLGFMFLEQFLKAKRDENLMTVFALLKEEQFDPILNSDLTS